MPDLALDLANHMIEAGAQFAARHPELTVKETVRGAFNAWERLSECFLVETHPPSHYVRTRLPPAPRLRS